MTCCISEALNNRSVMAAHISKLANLSGRGQWYLGHMIIQKNIETPFSS